MSNDDDFLPPEKSPVGGKFFNMKRLKTMPNRTATLRILSPLISGYVRWSADKKPIRFRELEDMPTNIKWETDPSNKDKEKQPQQFWACAVYNPEVGAEQVWEFTQATVYRQIKALKESSKWGIPTSYDLELSSEGEGLETKYTVLPCSKEPLSAGVEASWSALKASWAGLEALYEGLDPFEAKSEVPF